MNIAFNPQLGLVIVNVEVTGPTGRAKLQLALDTGATMTTISLGLLVGLGYDPALSAQRVQVTTASGVEYVPRVDLLKFAALGQDRLAFPVLCLTLPPTSGIDGLLGLDFFRGRILTLNFQIGEITLA